MAESMRVAGCDLGKATAKLVTARVDRDGALQLETFETLAHAGRPLEAFSSWYQRAEVGACAFLGATGIHADELRGDRVVRLPEDVCLETALEHLPALAALTGPLNVVSIGARGYSVLTRDAHGRVQNLENDKCSSGTGETMVKIARRFGLDVDEADRLALGAREAIPITARCSVFAKSEMTHFGNAGRPADALFRGYFRSVATYVAALLARARVDGPVVVVGGGARLQALVQALGEAVGNDVIVPDAPAILEAVGAAALAARAVRPGGDNGVAALPAVAAPLLHPVDRTFRTLPTPQTHSNRVRRLTAEPVPDGAVREPSILGLDLGSTGSKAVLTSVHSGALVLDLYDKTRGNPVDAAQRLVEAVLGSGPVDVRAVGVTGSGREAVATVLRAAYPELGERLVVVNEIVAHATAAIRCDPDGGESLSVVEIGGQDAKFIQIAGGQIVESDMNKACSAGTGSFLEEQAQFYGVQNVEEFTRRAQLAERPPDLGQMCTVFVAEAAGEARNAGYEVNDLFGGFQYAVVHNYLHRVMGQRTFGHRIFFQGKPATGPALAWTLAGVTDREVVVPANPGAMGAWGIGLCARENLGQQALERAPAVDLIRALAARAVARDEFQCRDARCATLCAIEKTTVQVEEAQHVVFSGGACPRFEISTAAAAASDKLPMEAPSAFDEREALLATFLEAGPARSGAPRVHLPLVGACMGIAPYLVTLLRSLGLAVDVNRPGRRSLSLGEAACHAFDACAPAKIAHGVADGADGPVFFPKLLGLGDREDRGGPTCAMEQALPELIRESLTARGSDAEVVHPHLDLSNGLESGAVVASLHPALSRLLGRPVGLRELSRAVNAAAAAQRGWEAGLAEIGRRTLAWAREHDRRVVVVCGALHVVHDPVLNAGIPAAVRRGGVLPLPMDAYPIPEEIHDMPRVSWSDARRALRVSAAARAAGDVYPLMLSSFGCSPASFVEQIFTHLMAGYPHTSLETDGHGGTAGYVTRVQAFLHSVRGHDGQASPIPPRRLEVVEPLREPELRRGGADRLVVLAIGDRLSSAVAAVSRAHGVDAVGSGPNTAESFALGRRDCSGKECLPYQLVWGAFRHRLEEDGTNGASPVGPDGTPRRNVLFQAVGQGMCRNCMFTVKDQLSLERLGLLGDVRLRHFGAGDDFGHSFLQRVWLGVVGWDLLTQLAAYHRPLERSAGDIDRLHTALCDELEEILVRTVREGPLGMVADNLYLDRALGGLVDRAARAYANVGRGARNGNGRPLRTVLLSGDIYVRLDEFASDGLTRRLNERGVRVLVEPTSVLIEYMARERLGEIFGLPTGFVDNAVFKRAMKVSRRRLYARVRNLHPWLPSASIEQMMKASATMLDRFPQGEAPVTVGSVLHHWAARTCDGVVVASPWGCGPALVSESLLRHRRDIPMLFVYCDGTPIDTRRLDAFTFRLEQRPARASTALRC